MYVFCVTYEVNSKLRHYVSVIFLTTFGFGLHLPQPQLGEIYHQVYTWCECAEPLLCLYNALGLLLTSHSVYMLTLGLPWLLDFFVAIEIGL